MKIRLSPRVSLVIIAAIFLLPLLLAWFMYTGTIDYQPASTRNLGQLVDPPLPMSWNNIGIIENPGQATVPAGKEFATHWVILRAVPDSCEETCVQQVTQLRQIHRAAGRNQSRVRIALLISESTPRATVVQLQEIYPVFRLIASQNGALEAVMRQAAGETSSTYLIDPLGNIMMVYETGADPNNLKKDLKRLLTWSKLDE